MAKIAGLALILLVAVSAGADIRWEPFEVPGGMKAELGHFRVPLNRARAESGWAELAFVRLRAGEASAGSPIIYLAGGPGQPATTVARNPYAIPALRRLAALGDVILLDQRGTGMSTPRPVCAAAAVSPEDVFVPAAKAMERYRSAARRCAREWAAKGIDVSAFNNRESAADVDDLRRELGAPKMRLIGFSYGTHLALAVIRAHGNNVERAVLIATAGLAHMRKLPLMLDTQLHKLSLLAAENPVAGPDVPDMTALTRRVLKELEREPMLVTVTDRERKKDVRVAIGADTMRAFLVADLGDGNDFPYFPALLLTVERRDPTILEWFAEKRYNQHGGINLMHLGMRCSAGAAALRDQQIRREAGMSIFGNTVNFPFPDVCDSFPAIDLGEHYREPLISSVPVLFVSGTLDSHTPPYQAEEVRWGMPHAAHLIVENAGHEDLEPNEEVQAVIGDYLAGKDVSARRVALPPPRFRSVEEAKKERRR